jgi:hypothetical protein
MSSQVVGATEGRVYCTTMYQQVSPCNMPAVQAVEQETLPGTSKHRAICTRHCTKYGRASLAGGGCLDCSLAVRTVSEACMQAGLLARGLHS